MQEKKIKKVKRKRPIAPWARWILKLTQHVAACIGILYTAALILTGSVYMEEYGARRWISPNVKNSGETAGTYFVQSLLHETETAIRLATIRSQMETNGVFDLDREVNISEYYYRKQGRGYTGTKYTYFPEAVYRLEDLIRWQQAGGLTYLNQEINFSQNNKMTETQVANNMFLTVDGKFLEELVDNGEEYTILCRQLSACMTDLRNNYDEYQRYMDRYAENKTSFVYYIQLDNAQKDVYTNKAELKNVSEEKLEAYFDGLICAGAGSTALNFSVNGSYEAESEAIENYISQYDYALGDNAVVYTGFDVNNGAEDYYNTLWHAYDEYDMTDIYMLMGIVGACALYYILGMLYMMCASGRRVDKSGEEYLEAKWTDSIVLELFLGWCAVLGFGICIAFIEMYEFFLHSRLNYIQENGAVIIMAVTFVLSILTMESFCSLARRGKMRTLFTNSIIYKFGISQLLRFGRFLRGKLHKIKHKTQYYLDRSGLWEKTWGFFIIELVFYMVCLSCIFLFLNTRIEEMALLTAAFMLAVTAIISFGRMRRKVERAEIVEKIEGIVAGDSCRVNEDHLSMENVALGHAVNEIGDGIRLAVKKSTKEERLKAELLTNVSHDIKTPLTSIISYVDLLKKEQIDSPKALEYIEVLESKSLKLKNLIQDLIEVSKISTGNIEYEMMPINFHELVLQAAGEYDERFSEHCLKLVYNNSTTDACILADSRRMWRVMENLLSNIYKYALEGTRVYMELKQVEDEVILTMKNISAKELSMQADELTERFVRGDLSRTTEGSGLGLAIAQNLVVGQDGKFKITLDGDLFKVQISFKCYEN